MLTGDVFNYYVTDYSFSYDIANYPQYFNWFYTATSMNPNIQAILSCVGTASKTFMVDAAIYYIRPAQTSKFNYIFTYIKIRQ